MSLIKIKEWQWDRSRMGGSGVILYSDHLVWYCENWAVPFTDMGAEQTLPETKKPPEGC